MPSSFERAQSAVNEAKAIIRNATLFESERIDLLQSTTQFASVLEKPEHAVTKLMYSRFVAV
jgi:hypothetical protein